MPDADSDPEFTALLDNLVWNHLADDAGSDITISISVSNTTLITEDLSDFSDFIFPVWLDSVCMIY